VTEKIKKGVKLDEVLEELRVETQSVRFEGDGYSEEWAIEAKARGLYVNLEFVDILERMQDECKVFVEVGACN
jgi:glutamine synthetase